MNIFNLHMDFAFGLNRQGTIEVSPQRAAFIRKGNGIMGQKLWGFHGEADTPAELLTLMQEQTAKLQAMVGGAPAKEKAAKKEAAPKEKEEKAAPAGPASTLEEVKKALTDLRDAIDAKEGPDKKLGLKAVKTLLKKYGVTQSTDLKEDQLGAVKKDAEAAMPEAGEDF